MRSLHATSTLGALHLAMLLCWQSSLFIPFVTLALASSLFPYIVDKKVLRLRSDGDRRPIAYWPLFFILCPFYLAIPADDDVYRYLWEGLVHANKLNPYLIAPEQLQLHFEHKDLINHPDWSAIYGPLFIQMCSWLAHPWVPQALFSVAGLKVIHLVLHLLNAKLLLEILNHSSANTASGHSDAPVETTKPSQDHEKSRADVSATQKRNRHIAGLYLCSPFLLLEGIGLAHFETWLCFAALLAIYGMQKHRPLWLTLGLCGSLWLKWWAIPLLPLFVRRKNLLALGATAALSLCILAPFWADGPAMFTSLLDFEGLWCNGYPHLFLQHFFESSTSILVALFAAALLFFVLLVGGSIQEQLWQFFRMSLFWAPTLHPWYWVMPLSFALCSGKTATFSLLSALALALHYPEFSWSQQGLWQSNVWSCLPFFFVLWLSEWRIRHHIFRERGETVESFSVITPCLNEEDNLNELGSTLSQHREHLKEWIVVDAGSSDQSIEIAKSWGAEVLTPNIKGRGPQIHHGIEHSQQAWCVVIHADTRFEPNFFPELKRQIARVPDLDGGAFRMIYRGHQSMGPLMFLNDLKMRLLGVSFGDQSQFFNKHRLRERGGFPQLPLMEDLELSLIWKGGNVCYITSTYSCTSPRRWQDMGRIKNASLIIKLLFIYLCRRHWAPPVDVAQLYRTYYQKP